MKFLLLFLTACTAEGVVHSGEWIPTGPPPGSPPGTTCAVWLSNATAQSAVGGPECWYVAPVPEAVR